MTNPSGPRPTPIVTLFTRRDCHLCDSARFVLERVQRDVPYILQVVDIDGPGSQHWYAQYSDHVPVVHLDGKEWARYRVDEADLRRALRGFAQSD